MKKVTIAMGAIVLFSLQSFATSWSANLDCGSQKKKSKMSIVNLSVSVGGLTVGNKRATVIDENGLAYILRDSADSSGSRDIWTSHKGGSKFNYKLVNVKTLKKYNRNFTDHSYNYEKFKATLVIEKLPSKKDSNTPKVTKIFTDTVICEADYKGVD